MSPLIKLKIGKDGELALLIHEYLWQEIREKEAAEESEEGKFFCIELGMILGESIQVFASPPTDNDPCRPVVRVNRI